MKKILGIGNALVDVLIKLESDDLLNELNLPKGSMQLISAEQAKSIQERIKNLPQEMVSGGSSANTIHGITLLGGNSAFLGSVGKDELGDHFEKNLQADGIEPKLIERSSDSGVAYTFITPDAERTFATFLGAAVELDESLITHELLQDVSIMHLEGYLVQNYTLVETALAQAKKRGIKTSIDLASYNIVEANKDFLTRVLQEYVDIVFANEEEAKAFTGKTPADSVELFGCYCDIAVVKLGSEGSIVKRRAEKYEIGVEQVVSLDTTGAGDQYAAGFLYGLENGYDLVTCGKTGAAMAAQVITRLGARLTQEEAAEIKARLKV